MCLISFAVFCVVASYQDIALALSGRPSRATLRFASSDLFLERSFNWSRNEALSYVMTDKAPNNMASYWAGYPERPAFYLRDMAHQAAGAHLLGLDEENFQMARAFATSATEARRWYPLWSFGFNGSIFMLDFKNDSYFVHELPEPFDLMRRLGGLLDWTGEARLVKDPALAAFYNRTIRDFKDLHDPNGTGVAGEFEGDGHDIFQGVASYNEWSQSAFGFAADALAAQYAADLTFAKFAEFRGDASVATASASKASKLRDIFNKDWVDQATSSFLVGITRNGTQVTRDGASTNVIFPLNAGLAAGGTVPTDKALDFLESEAVPSTITELRCQMPEAFFRYGRPDPAAALLKNLMDDNRRTYPEVSFAVVENCVTGILGVLPSALTRTINTTHRLPTNTEWAAAWHIAIGDFDLHMQQERLETGALRSMLTYSMWHGNDDAPNITWNARFEGKHETLEINGVTQKATLAFQEGDHRLPLGSVTVSVAMGEAVVVATPTSIII